MQAMVIFDILTSLIFAASLASFSTQFEKSFLIPQVIFLLLFTFLISIRSSLRIPARLLLFGMLLFLIGFMFPVLSTQLVLITILMCLLLASNYLETQDFQRLKNVVILVSVFEAVLVWISVLGLQSGFNFEINGVPIGTTGNSDFLASVLAAGFLFLQEKTSLKKSKLNTIKFLFLVFIFASLVITRSKGTIFLLLSVLTAPLLTPLFKKIKNRPLYFIPTSLTFLAIAYFTHNLLLGRIQLWGAATYSIMKFPLLGTGDGNFSSAYFLANLELFERWPNLRQIFGPWSSQASDAHNIILDWGVRWGVLGAAVAGILVFNIIKSSLRQVNSSEGKLLLILVVKSLYTVVVGSIQGVALIGAFGKGTIRSDQSKKSKTALILATFFILGMCFSSLYKESVGNYHLARTKHALMINLNEFAKNEISQAGKLSSDPEIILSNAYVEMSLNNCDGARTLALQATKIRHDMDFYKRAGHILFECTYYDDAKTLFADLHVVFPEHRTTTTKLAWIDYYQGNWDSAEALAQEVLSSTPRRESYSDAKNLTEAKEILRKVTR